MTLDRQLDSKNYPYCLSFSDPFPNEKPAFGMATITATVRLVGYSTSKTLTRGATVLAAKSRGGYTSIFDPTGSGAEGCVLSTKLASSTLPPATGAWDGRWRKIGDPPKLPDEMTIRTVGKKLSLRGTAYWGVPGYYPNSGSLDGSGVPMRNTLQIKDPEEPDCAVTVTALGGFLIASQPRADQDCSEMGSNVTFSGVYRRVQR